MALIREVRKHSLMELYAYVEYSDEDKNSFTMLGGREFNTREQAEEYAKGFAPDSYEWVEPDELKRSRLNKERERLKEQLSKVENELLKLDLEQDNSNQEQQRKI